VVTAAEREVADLLAIEVDPVVARATVETVPFWFHTFALNRAEGIYTPETVTASDDHGQSSPPRRRSGSGGVAVSRANLEF
jgi:hypothetical protein